MHGFELFEFSHCSWWIFPVVMMVLCFLMMRGRRGWRMCGFGSCGTNTDHNRINESAKDILDMRYAKGEIGKVEYEEMSSVLAAQNDTRTN